MRFGVGQFTLQIPPWDRRDHAQLYADTLDLADLAEQAGLHSFWLAEHHGAQDGYIPSLLPFLSAVAARTTRIELGTAVMLAPFHDPLRLAEDTAVVDNISGGRLNVGLGLGWAPEEYRMFGVPQKGRGRRLEEVVQVLRAAWTRERFSFSGRHLSYDDVSVTPKPKRTPPLWLGGNAPEALARAARIADGHFPPSTLPVEGLAARAREMLELRRSLGVEGPYRFGMFVPVGLGADADEGWAAIRDGLLHVRGSYMLWAQGQRDVTGASEAAAPFAEQVRAGVLVGTPKEVAERLRPIVEEVDSLGLEEAFFSAILAPPGTTLQRGREAIERYGELIAALR